MRKLVFEEVTKDFYKTYEETKLKKMYDNILDTYDKSSNYFYKKESIMTLLSEFYDYFRDNSQKIRRDFFEDLHFYLCYEYIIDIPKNMLPKLEEKELKEKMTVRDMLDYIVYKVRDKAANKSIFGRDYFVKHDMLTHKSEEMSDEVIKVCEDVGIKVIKVKTNEAMGIMAEPNTFCVAELNGEDYIIDCSYRQFCGLANRNLGVFKTYAHGTPGAILMNTSKGEQLAGNLLRNGWIPCTEENLKRYLDSFYLSGICNGVHRPYFKGKTVEEYVSQINNYNRENNIGSFEIKCQEDKTNQMVRSRED